MNNTLSFVKLDYMTVKQYFTWKTALLLLAVSIFVGYSTGEVTIVIGMSMMFGIVIACYPFAVGEKNGLETLYSTLPITRKNIVTGRYLFTIFLDLIMLGISLVLSFALMKVLGNELHATFVILTASICFVFFSLIVAIQLPLFFKFGYIKAKLLAYLPLVCFPMVVIIANSFFGESRVMPMLSNALVWTQNNILLTVIIAIAIWISIMLISWTFSLMIYKKKEL